MDEPYSRTMKSHTGKAITKGTTPPLDTEIYESKTTGGRLRVGHRPHDPFWLQIPYFLSIGSSGWSVMEED